MDVLMMASPQEGMLARFAAALQRGQLQAIAGAQPGGGGGAIVVDQDNCNVSPVNCAHLRRLLSLVPGSKPTRRWLITCSGLSLS